MPEVTRISLSHRPFGMRGIGTKFRLHLQSNLNRVPIHSKYVFVTSFVRSSHLPIGRERSRDVILMPQVYTRGELQHGLGHGIISQCEHGLDLMVMPPFVVVVVRSILGRVDYTPGTIICTLGTAPHDF